MKSLGAIRLMLLGVLLLFLSLYIYLAFIGYKHSPIAIKEQLEYGQMKFFPAVTICPFPDSEVGKKISFRVNTITFKRAVEMAIGPLVYDARYITYK